jgi:DNA-binding beta-propeller fold protein YncE
MESSSNKAAYLIQIAPDPSVFELIVKERSLNASFGDDAASKTGMLFAFKAVSPQTLQTRFYRAEFLVDDGSAVSVANGIDYVTYYYGGRKVIIADAGENPSSTISLIVTATTNIMGVAF